MISYFDEVDHRRLLSEYPIGQAFLDGPVRLSRDELHALQERRFLAVIAREHGPKQASGDGIS